VLDDVKNEVFSLLNDHPSYTVVVTGHSLGAAMALLTAQELANSGVNKVSLYSFGCPRVGNDEFAAYVNNHHRFLFILYHPHISLLLQGGPHHRHGPQNAPSILRLPPHPNRVLGAGGRLHHHL